jgi:hypothetical protein
MARLTISWQSVNTVSPKAASTVGETDEQTEEAKPAASSSMRAERPMMVFIMADDPTEKTMRKLEDVVFKDERVCIGAKFFKCVKITEGDALQDRILRETGKHAPRVVMVNCDYSVCTKLEGRSISASRLGKAMKKTVKKDYTNNYDKLLKAYAKLLNEFDRLEATRTKIADTEKRLRDKPSASKAKKLERTRKEYEKDHADWKEREAKLLALELRNNPDKPEA